jgi:hypothetical protein
VGDGGEGGGEEDSGGVSGGTTSSTTVVTVSTIGGSFSVRSSTAGCAPGTGGVTG